MFVSFFESEFRSRQVQYENLFGAYLSFVIVSNILLYYLLARRLIQIKSICGVLKHIQNSSTEIQAEKCYDYMSKYLGFNIRQMVGDHRPESPDITNIEAKRKISDAAKSEQQHLIKRIQRRSMRNQKQQ